MGQSCFSNIAMFCFVSFFTGLPFSAGQDVPAANTTPTVENTYESESPESLKIKVSVNEVRLDVVVLDKKTRNPITDLSAANFEVFQDNKRQDVLTGVYIDSQSDAVLQPTQSKTVRENARNFSPVSAPTINLKKKDVRRTIIFVIDDLSMSFENGYYAKMALRNFVEKQMQPDDMVAIIKTSYGNSALQMFISDKREALARINSIHLEIVPRIFTVFDGQLFTLSYSLRALKDMPGRKILIMMSANMTVPETYYERFNRLTDDALRAGVVVNFLNITGLNYSIDLNRGALFLFGADASLGFQRDRDDMFITAARKAANITHAGLSVDNPLPIKTGGVTINESNFFLEGIGRETESLMNGYYLISYTPPPDTFNEQGKKVNYRRLKVRVNRKNTVVYTRDGFFGKLESETDAEATEQDPLIEAIYSPFRSTDLSVDIASGYTKDAKGGYFVHSWIHIDPKDVKIVEMEDGKARIDLEAVCLTSDVNGNIADSKRVEFSFSVFDTDWYKKHGIRFSMLLPVKKPGPYYVRISIKDAGSGKLGSAYQFLEIPDLNKKGLELSNVFIVNNAEELKLLTSVAEEEIEEGLFFPVFQAEEMRNPALRTYSRGDRINALTMLYNAGGKAASGSSEIEVQYVLYRNGKELRRFPSALFKPPAAGNADGIPVLQGFTLGADISPGDYVLQLIATDKKNSKKQEGIAIKALGFTVTEK